MQPAASPGHLPASVANSALTAACARALSTNKHGEIFLYRHPLSLDSLEAQLGQSQTPADSNLLTEAGATVKFGRVAQVLAAVRHTGIHRLSVMTQAQ